MSGKIKSFLYNPIFLGIVVCIVIFSISILIILNTQPNFDDEGCALDENENRIRKPIYGVKESLMMSAGGRSRNKTIIGYDECVKSTKTNNIIFMAVISVIMGCITTVIMKYT